MQHYELEKVYPNGDEDTGLYPGYRDGVMQVSGTAKQAIQVAEEQFSDELYPGEVELEIHNADTGEFVARLQGRCPGLENALSNGL
jgi:hypothetical protein